MASNLKKKKLAGAVEMQMYFKLKIKKKKKMKQKILQIFMMCEKMSSNFIMIILH